MADIIVIRIDRKLDKSWGIFMNGVEKETPLFKTPGAARAYIKNEYAAKAEYFAQKSPNRFDIIL